MLRWRRKSELKRHKLWAKLVACSFGMHLIFLVLLFVGYRDNIKLIFSMSGRSLPKKAAPVTLFTFPAPKPQRTVRRATSARRTAQKRVVKKPVTKVAAKKTTPKQLVQKTVKKAPAKKTVAAAKPKLTNKKIAQNKAKPIQKKVAHVDKKITSKKEQNIAQVEQEAIQFDTNQKIDQSMMQDFIALQQELAKHWQPPVGIADECACALTAHINRQGTIEDITIDDSSGVLMFDVAARTAMLAMELPRWTWGKSLSITFKP